MSEAVEKAGQILDEERVRPTLSYEPVDHASKVPELAASAGWTTLAVLSQIGSAQLLNAEREAQPRRVHESPDDFQLKSTNFELLLALFSQVAPSDRNAFVESLLARVRSPLAAHKSGASSARYPSWNGCSSELPLVAEFSVRVGFKEEFLRAVSELRLSAGYVLFLMELEDMLALNFNLFADADLERLASALTEVRSLAIRKTQQFTPQPRPSRGAPHGARPKIRNPEYDARFVFVAMQIVAVCGGIVEECRQARYWYLKGALEQSANLEVNLDRSRVEGYLQSLGFSGVLAEALNAAESDFRNSATPFELKNCLGHLRSFLEGLHEQACYRLAMKAGTAAPRKWGKTTEMLRASAILSRQEEGLAASLYTLMSYEGVHPLMAEREYARLLRNMTIEYGLLFLTKLERSGLKLS